MPVADFGLALSTEKRFSGSATNITISCSGRRRSSITTGSGWIASGKASLKPVPADLLAELLPLVDDMERALKADAGGEGAEAYAAAWSCSQPAPRIAAEARCVDRGARRSFDPHYHQAVAHEAVEGRRDGE